LINDVSYYNGQIFGTKDKPNVIEFIHEFENDKQYSLIIRRKGKASNQTVTNTDGKIIKDQLLHIQNIEIDEIEMGALIYEGEFSPEYPEPWASEQRKFGVDLPKTMKNVCEMGHNGTWQFNFNTPFYMWFIDNRY